jgi:hypothetical protein
MVMAENYSDMVIQGGNCNITYVSVSSEVKLSFRLSRCGIKELDMAMVAACENLAVRREERSASVA